LKTLMNICNRFIKIFSLSSRSIDIIFASHHLEILSKCLFRFLKQLSFDRIWINWFSSFPIILYSFLKKIMFTYSVTWSLVNISKLILILWLTCFFIEKFLILCMIISIIFWICNMRSIVPRRYFSTSWQVYAILKSIHFILFVNILF
jgi:hypothetical protein